MKDKEGGGDKKQRLKKSGDLKQEQGKKCWEKQKGK